MNKATLIGNVGGDVEVKNGIAKFSLATTDQWTDKQSGEKKESTQWHRITAFRQHADEAAKLAKKGAFLRVEGAINYSKYTDKDGVERHGTEIVASKIEVVEKKAAA